MSLMFISQETSIKIGTNEPNSHVQLNEDDKELDDMEASKEVKISSARNDGRLEIEKDFITTMVMMKMVIYVSWRMNKET